MLLTKKVKLKWNIKNKEWYVNKGYLFTKMKDAFEVNVEDLSDGSHARVDIKCDGCGKQIKEEVWKNYKRCVRNDGKYYCNKCAKNGDKKSLNYEEWCYDSLSKEEADRLLSRWDYELNIDDNGKVLYPKEISHGADKKYWFKCLDNPNHIPELKSIHSCVCGEGSFECIQCKSISVTHPYLISMFINKGDALRYSAGSKKKIRIKCPHCGYEKNISPDVLLRAGFGCPRCSDGVSYPEKFMASVLEQLKINFIPQLSKSVFSWCGDFKYDFYLTSLNSIIETHGGQHYINKSSWKITLSETQDNDKYKELLARHNNIKNYIVIDCRNSELNWIKHSIMDSQLPDLLNFEESNINWIKCHEFACKNMIKKVCELWRKGEKSTSKISFILKLHKSTVNRYLKRGSKLGWCDYDGKEEQIKNLNSNHIANCRKVICLNTMEIFNSSVEAAEKYNIQKSNIYACCNKHSKYAGIHPQTEEKMVWMYYDEYLYKNNNLSSEWKDEYIRNKKFSKSKVICLNTGEVFNTQKEAGTIYNVSQTTISACCKGDLRSAGRNPETKEKLVWMYYDDYTTKTLDQINEVLNRATSSYKKVKCLTTGEVFNTALEAIAKYDIRKNSLYSCLSNKQSYAGNHPETGEKLRWVYYSELD